MRIAGVRRGRAAFVAVCLVLVAEHGRAIDYEPITLACLIANADAAVVATLPRQPDGVRYSVHVQRSLSGEPLTRSVTVIEPAPWRGMPPQFVDREALLFLKRADGRTWQVIGPSGEGRIGLSADVADVRAINLPISGQYASVYSREELVDAIAAAGECFAFRAKGESVRPIARCDKRALDRAAAASLLHAGLIRQLQEAPAEGLPCRL